jgi:hypothetical protein
MPRSGKRERAYSIRAREKVVEPVIHFEFNAPVFPQSATIAAAMASRTRWAGFSRCVTCLFRRVALMCA